MTHTCSAALPWTNQIAELHQGSREAHSYDMSVESRNYLMSSKNDPLTDFCKLRFIIVGYSAFRSGYHTLGKDKSEEVFLIHIFSGVVNDRHL